MALSKKEREALTKEMLHAKFGGCCAFCGDPLGERWHVCGIKPLKSSVTHKGEIILGDDSYENKLPACIPCNLSRLQHSYDGLLDIEQFRQSLYGSFEFLKENAYYKRAVRYGLITETDEPIIFHFEKYK